eukprot:scaffold1661_cov251-Pinguiococcus_pyrenoidosus.AAC.52
MDISRLCTVPLTSNAKERSRLEVEARSQLRRIRSALGARHGPCHNALAVFAAAQKLCFQTNDRQLASTACVKTRMLSAAKTALTAAEHARASQKKATPPGPVPVRKTPQASKRTPLSAKNTAQSTLKISKSVKRPRNKILDAEVLKTALKRSVVPAATASVSKPVRKKPTARPRPWHEKAADPSARFLAWQEAVMKWASEDASAMQQLEDQLNAGMETETMLEEDGVDA